MFHATTIKEINEQLAAAPLALVYLSMPNCSVCVSVKPQLLQHFEGKVPIIHGDAAEIPEIAGEFQVLTAPAVLLFAHQKEVARQARFIDFHKLETLIENYLATPESVDYEQLFH